MKAHLLMLPWLPRTWHKAVILLAGAVYVFQLPKHNRKSAFLDGDVMYIEI